MVGFGALADVTTGADVQGPRSALLYVHLCMCGCGCGHTCVGVCQECWLPEVAGIERAMRGWCLSSDTALLSCCPASLHEFAWLLFIACRLQRLVEAGPHAPAGETGAKFIIRKDGRRINLAYLRDGASKALEVSPAWLAAAVVVR